MALFFVDTHLHELVLQNGSKITLNYNGIYIQSGNAWILTDHTAKTNWLF